MSKSKKNVIDPEFIIKNFGADSVRLFILSDSPPEKDVQWSEQGMASSYKFIQKMWTLHCEIKNKLKNDEKSKVDEKLNKFISQIIYKITNNLEKFNYNVIIANIYETYNYLNKYIKDNKDILNLESNYVKIITCLSPVIPHFANECLEDIGYKDNLEWPKINKKLLEDEKVNFVIQINGKKRLLLNVSKNINESDLMKILEDEDNLNKYLGEKKIKKTIFVPNRLINILT